jgi:protein TonB
MELHDYSDPMPSFPGGQTSFYEYLKNNLEYPKQAKEIGIVGRVLINFIVECDGDIFRCNTCKKAPASASDEEAISSD